MLLQRLGFLKLTEVTLRKYPGVDDAAGMRDSDQFLLRDMCKPYYFRYPI
jgi:hypothetical protein